MTSVFSLICVVFAFVFFAIGASYPRWAADRQPYFPALVSLGLAFLTLGVWLLPMALGK